MTPVIIAIIITAASTVFIVLTAIWTGYQMGKKKIVTTYAPLMEPETSGKKIELEDVDVMDSPWNKAMETPLPKEDTRISTIPGEE